MRTSSGWIWAGLLCLAGCDGLGPFGAYDHASPPPSPPYEEAISPESREVSAYYQKVEQGHRTRGLLRIDGGGPDVPFDDRRLYETFMATAFSREFTDVGAALVRREGDSQMHRWETPIRIQTIFGASVPDARRAEDSAAIQRYADRLGRVTGHPISYVERGGNFPVLILSEDERQVSGPLMRRLIPGIRDREIALIENLDLATYCIVVASDPKDDGVLTRAAAVIRAELPPLLRLSCIHEEIAQGLGLANDSPRARPSIFNDDDEFGRLTTMDEQMLQMLYSPLLSPGIDAETARPVARQLAKALTAPAF